MRPNFTIVRCQTNDKERVMGILCDADEYKQIRDHVDAVYYNGDTPKEKQETRLLVADNIALLKKEGIEASTSPKFLDEWFFISK